MMLELAIMKEHYLQPGRAARVFVCLSCAPLSFGVGYVLILLQGGLRGRGGTRTCTSVG